MQSQSDVVAMELELVLESLGHPAWLSDSATRTVKCNEVFLSMTQSSSCIEGESWLSFIATADREVARRAWHDHEGSGRFQVQVDIARSRMAQLPCELIASRLSFCGTGDLWIFQAVPLLLDVSAERSFADQIPHLKRVLDATPALGWYASEAGVLMWVGSRLGAYLGIPETHPLRVGQDIGNTWTSHLEFVHSDDREVAIRDWEKSLCSSTPHETRFRVAGANGIYRWFLVRADPVFDHRGQVTHWIGINVDIDDFLRAGEELRASEERLSRAMQIAAVAEMSASIAHEINQPLGAIAANAHAAATWLSSDPPNLERARNSIERIERDSRAAADVVQKMRRLFRQQPPKRQLVHLGSTINQALTLLESEVRKRSVVLQVDVPEKLALVNIDSVQIQQVLVNLVTNAMDAVDARALRIVKLHVSSSEEEVTISVSDTGEGVANAGRIFEAFFTTKERGMGMGLAVSRSIAEAHDGSLSVANRPEGGAEFVLHLPRTNKLIGMDRWMEAIS